MKKINRNIESIEYDIKKAYEARNEAIRKGSHTKVQALCQQIKRLEAEKSEKIETDQFRAETESQDKHLRNWAGKSLSLTVNLCDLAIFQIDSFHKYFKARGYEPKEGWVTKRMALEKAINEFRKYNMEFFVSRESKENNSLNAAELLDLIEGAMFTDRERVYQKKFSE